MRWRREIKEMSDADLLAWLTESALEPQGSRRAAERASLRSCRLATPAGDFPAPAGGFST
jgi:hypothetical protein